MVTPFASCPFICRHLPPASPATPTVDAALAAPAVAPQLTYRNGPLIAAPEVFTIFWGSAWNAAQAGLATQVNQLFDFISGQVFYAVMPYPSCAGCTGGLSPIDALTSTSSHELCEAITDAIPGQGWYDDSNGEIGDICAWKTKKIGAYAVQLEWSNKANACV